MIIKCRFFNLPIVKRGKESKLGTVGVPITRWNYIRKVYDCTLVTVRDSEYQYSKKFYCD